MENEQYLIAEVASRPLKQEQQENLAWWDHFIENIGERLMEERKAYHIYNPKDSVIR